MEVYIEYAILDNLIMDYVLLKETAIILKTKYKKSGLLFASIIGTIGAILMPLLKIKPVYLFLLKIALGVVVAFIGVKHKNFISFFRFFNVFLLMTFVLGGACIGVLSIMGVEYTISGYKAAGVLPIGVNVAFGYLLVITTKYLVKKYLRVFITDKYVLNCLLKHGEVVVKVSGYFDSGNKLFDKKTGLPIVLCDKKIIEKMKSLGAVFFPPREFSYSTVAGEGAMYLYAVDCILIEREGQNFRRNLLLGAVENKNFETDLLLGAHII